MDIHTSNWIVDVGNCIEDTYDWIMDIHDYTQLQMHI